MVCGTSSDAGKSVVVTGLCRLLARRGIRVAPFKAQNMSNNSFVTASGHEIGRAQAAQAMAARVEPVVSMNPILLKPTSAQKSQVILNGRPMAELSFAEYHQRQDLFVAAVRDALADLRSRFDVVVAEGAGSPAEINLRDRDIVNLQVAEDAKLPALIVGDIERGGVFASLFGTVALLPESQRRLVRGFIINKFRGDVGLLAAGTEELEQRCGVPTLGVLPWCPEVAIDAEDSLSLDRLGRTRAEPVAHSLDVAVVRLPHISNFTDFEPLAAEPGVAVRVVSHPTSLGDPDLVILPGTKATVSDLRWLRSLGFDAALARLSHARGTTVLGICGGYQMLGNRILDEVESGHGEVPALGWLDVKTIFGSDKITRQRRGTALGASVAGYEIRHGQPRSGSGAMAWLRLDDVHGEEEEGAVASGDFGVLGTSLHGLFESDGFRVAFLTRVAERRGRRFDPGPVCFADLRDRAFDAAADLLENHLGWAALEEIICRPVGSPPPGPVTTPSRGA